MAARAGFALLAVAHLQRPWGEPVRGLEALREALASAPDEVLFAHTVHPLLRHARAAERPPDDLSAWVAGVVRDAETAERLSFAAQTHAADHVAMRAAFLEVLERVPVAVRGRTVPAESALRMRAVVSVVFPTGIVADGPDALVDALVTLDPCVWFHHLVQEPWFHDGRDEAADWAHACGATVLARRLREVAAAGEPLERARARLRRRWRQSRLALRLVERAERPEDDRRDEARATVGRWVHRVVRREGGP